MEFCVFSFSDKTIMIWQANKASNPHKATKKNMTTTTENMNCLEKHKAHLIREKGEKSTKPRESADGYRETTGKIRQILQLFCMLQCIRKRYSIPDWMSGMRNKCCRLFFPDIFFVCPTSEQSYSSYQIFFVVSCIQNQADLYRLYAV